MPNRSYIQGRNLEQTVKRILEERGMFATRSAASKTVVDVTALNQSTGYLVQCKTTGEELPDLKKLLNEPNVIKLQEMKVPTGDFFFFVKYIIWKGKGQRNYYQFRWLGTKWVMCSTKETQLISIDEFLDTPRKRSNDLKKKEKERQNKSTEEILSKLHGEVVDGGIYEGEQTTIEEVINGEKGNEVRGLVNEQETGTTPTADSGGKQRPELANEAKQKGRSSTGKVRRDNGSISTWGRRT